MRTTSLLCSITYLVVVAWPSTMGIPYQYPGGGFYNNYLYNGHPGNAADSFHVIKSLKQRLLALERTVRNQELRFSPRMEDLEEVVTALAQQECQTNVVVIEVCPGFDEANTNSILDCVIRPTAGGPSVNVTRDVIFNRPFLHPPALDIGLSGVTVVSAKNCSVEVRCVSEEGFTFTFIADDFLPVQIQLTWFACPSALFAPGQSLPGGLAEDLAEGPESSVYKHTYIAPGEKVWD